jgi:hypothetical protein
MEQLARTLGAISGKRGGPYTGGAGGRASFTSAAELNASHKPLNLLEATPGIEPGYTVLQTVA